MVPNLEIKFNQRWVWIVTKKHVEGWVLSAVSGVGMYPPWRRREGYCTNFQVLFENFI